MNRKTEELSLDMVELGIASEETQGNDLVSIEGGGFLPAQGISDE